MVSERRNKSKEKKGYWTVATCILLLLMLSAPISALESNVVAIEDITASPGGVVIVPIVVERATGIGGIGIKLSYDPSVVKVRNATQGDFTAFFGFDNTNAANGWVTINTFILGQNLTGDVKVADVRLEAVGNAGDSSILDLTILSMADQYGTDVNGTTDNGVFSILSPSKEQRNGGAGGGGGGETLPSKPPATPTPLPSPVSIGTPTPTPMVMPSLIPSFTPASIPAPTPVITTTPRNTQAPRIPGFEVILGITEILIAGSCIVAKKKGK